MATARPKHDLPPKPDVTAKLELITPAKADALLANRAPNREISRARVDELSSYALAGRFVMNGDTVVIDQYRRLMNGQHRIKMISETGIPQWMLVVRGIKYEEAMHTIDVLGGRTIAQGIKVLGLTMEQFEDLASLDTKQLQATASWVWQYRSGEWSTLGGNCSVSMRPIDIIPVFAAYPGIGPAVREACQFKKLLTGWFTVNQGAFLLLGGSFRDSGMASRFLHQVATGADIGINAPAMRLRQYLHQVIRDTHNGRSRRDAMAHAILAWNAFAAGKELKRGLHWHHGMPFPRFDPDITPTTEFSGTLDLSGVN